MLKVSSEVHSVARTLDRLADSQRQLEISSDNRINELRKAIAISLRDAMRDSKYSQGEPRANFGSIDIPPELSSNLTELVHGSQIMQRQVDIVRSLGFDGVSEREEGIKDAHPQTFEWLYDEVSNTGLGASNILHWLRQGSGTFWVSGKAGSGKSTLMKFFHQDKRTEEALTFWAGESQVVTSSFFFWNAGNRMQKSQQGLLQTLLYHILRHAPDLMPTICSSRWARPHALSHWTFQELTQTFHRLQQEQTQSTHFCFFIDGVDEYEGEHLDIIDIIHHLIKSTHIKICFSSRPWNVFERAYGENDGRKIRLQDLTRSDIERFAGDKLTEGQHSFKMHVQEQAYRNLVKEIVDKSDGVFLWVYLVVRSLRRGMTNLDTPLELQTRLRELPTELEAFFRHILNSTENVYHRHAARLYRICLVARTQMSALDLAWFAEEDPYFGLRDDLVSIDPLQLYALSQDTVMRVHARCQDLLEFKGADLQFIHRTVVDFLNTGDIAAQLESRSGENFVPFRYICNSMLLQIRLKARIPQPSSIHWDRFHELKESFLFYARDLDQRQTLKKQMLEKLHEADSVFGDNHHCASTSDQNDSDQVAYDHTSLAQLSRSAVRRTHCGAETSSSRGVGAILLMCRNAGTGSKTRRTAEILKVTLKDMTSELEHLLEEGEDPNAKNGEGVSFWEEYISALAEQMPDMSLRSLQTGICKLLLLHGADPLVGGKEDEYNRVLKSLRVGDALELEDIRQNMLSKSVIMEHDQSTSTLAIRSNKRTSHSDEDDDVDLSQHCKRRRKNSLSPVLKADQASS